MLQMQHGPVYGLMRAMPAFRVLIACTLALAATAAAAHAAEPGALQRVDAQILPNTATRTAMGQPASKSSAVQQSGAAESGGLRPPIGALAFAVVGAVLLLRGRVPEARQPRAPLND